MDFNHVIISSFETGLVLIIAKLSDVPALQFPPGEEGEEEGDAGEDGGGEEGAANPESLSYTWNCGGGSPQGGIDLDIIFS